MISKQIIKKQIQKKLIQNTLGRKWMLKRKVSRLLETALPQQDVEGVENGTKDKAEVVRACCEQWPKNAKALQKWIDKLFAQAPTFLAMNDSEKEKIRTDILFCRFAYGFDPDEYISYRLDIRNPEERRSFISEREHMLYYYKMNDLYAAETFNDKMKTYTVFKEYYGRSLVPIETAKDFDAFRDFVQKHPVFVKKEVDKSCGRSIEKIDINTCGKTEKELFDSLIARGKTVLEECVIQHPVTEVFNDSSVNTVRIITFNTKHGIVAPFAFFKVGRKGSFVDNGGAGGIFISIDEKTGVLQTRGIDEIHREYDHHPDSGVKFYGYQVPEWDKAVALCIQLAALTPKAKYIGWDLAYTKDNEWIIIEGNGMSQFIGPQSTLQRGIKAEVLSLMEDIDLVF